MKGSVEHSDLRRAGQVYLTRIDAAQVVWIMKRSDLKVISNALDDLISDEYRGSEPFTAVDNPVSDSMDIRPVADDSMVATKQHSKNILDGDDVIHNLAGNLDLIPVMPNIRKRRPAHPNSLNGATCQRFFCVDIDELIFD
jgi:hypothetical protein